MKKIYAKQLEEKLKAGEQLNILDVREDEEVATGKIPGAKHIPLGQIPERLNELVKDKPYYIVCRSGGRSGQACAFLSAKGYDVTNVEGGMLAWEGETE
ncbi:rhodanese-like domain-containing protein [Caldibacillus thermolactis]|jgi:rhodanese-related sulfurtransferase|uniref:Rhodanese-like domain-containing protein n=1 Tax=Pallidibacillus thermolactis TaxID=251051 RepID=A0ABT2WFU0_9BACI|nr:rhodanese-like domain-containing protein [Pallidibacillus thermolactis]MCU9594561.1 rhodanese-like domain-containing protein [Pallidibacillus thermolactis]MCU9602089.1 rhodanese-like domain-containing protein [Pallidibacillus thermolactis subsp. kokeshiiformis]MED1674191.1 rhodanese-like domain-containing protein [Pallidibacillus thermolactis subsp. kokeshiiformis]